MFSCFRMEVSSSPHNQGTSVNPLQPPSRHDARYLPFLLCPGTAFCPVPAWKPRAGTQPASLSLWRLRIRVARMEFTCLISEWAHRMACGKTTLEVHIRLLLMTKETPSHPPLAFPGVGRIVALCGFSQGLSMALY